MEQKYINKELSGLKENNLEKLKQIFPNCIKDGQVDFEELKNMLGEFEQVDKEIYEFNWVGKQKTKQEANNGISGKTLKFIEKDSKNLDLTKNIYIEGDNLEALKLLKSNYSNSIKMIYIDPPYNTGEDFIYNDNYTKSSKQIDEDLNIVIDGEKQVNINKDLYYKNTKEANKYHSIWLNLMYPRLSIAQELLSEDGVIFISIDDNEVDNISKVCNEIFREYNFLTKIIVNRPSEIANNYTISKHEYILVYCKNKNKFTLNSNNKYTISRGTVGNENQTTPIITFPRGLKCYNIPDGIYKETRKIKNSMENVQNLDDIIVKNGKLEKEVRMTARWRSSNDMRNFFENNCNPTKAKISGEIIEIYFENDKFNPQIKKITPEKISSMILNNKRGSKWLEELDIKGCFSFPKSVDLIKDLMKNILNDNDIILDFFSGSATTAHSVMQLNSENGGNIRYIMVQLQEDLEYNLSKADSKSKTTIESAIKFLKLINKPLYLNEIGKERIRRAGEKIKQELIDKGETYKANKLDIGFKVFKVDNTNINWESKEYKEKFDNKIFEKGFDMTFNKDILISDFVDGAKDIDIVYELLLRYYNVPLTTEIILLSDIGSRTYSIGGIIIVCLEDEITKGIIDKLANIDFSKLYLRDSSFKGDKALELKENLMTRLNLQKGFKDNKTYKVEFI